MRTWGITGSWGNSKVEMLNNSRVHYMHCLFPTMCSRHAAIVCQSGLSNSSSCITARSQTTNGPQKVNARTGQLGTKNKTRDLFNRADSESTLKVFILRFGLETRLLFSYRSRHQFDCLTQPIAASDRHLPCPDKCLPTTRP